MNGIKPPMAEAGDQIKLENGSASRAAEVLEAPDRSGQGEGEVAILSGEGLQAIHAPPNPEQQEAKLEPLAGTHVVETGMSILGKFKPFSISFSICAHLQMP